MQHPLFCKTRRAYRCGTAFPLVCAGRVALLAQHLPTHTPKSAVCLRHFVCFSYTPLRAPVELRSPRNASLLALPKAPSALGILYVFPIRPCVLARRAYHYGTAFPLVCAGRVALSAQHLPTRTPKSAVCLRHFVRFSYIRPCVLARRAYSCSTAFPLVCAGRVALLAQHLPTCTPKSAVCLWHFVRFSYTPLRAPVELRSSRNTSLLTLPKAPSAFGILCAFPIRPCVRARRAYRKSAHTPYGVRRFCSLVPVVGLEPTRSRPLGILSPVRLPFRHTGSGK